MRETSDPTPTRRPATRGTPVDLDTYKLTPAPRRPSTSPLWAALASERETRVDALARMGQATGLLGLGLSVIALAYDVGLAVPSLFIVLFCLGWFTVVRVVDKRSPIGRFVREASPVVVISVPFGLLLIIWRVRGPELALSSWLPPEMIIAFTTMSAFRLRAAVPLFMGTVGAVGYLAVYLAVYFLEPSVRDADVMRPGLTVLRTFTFFSVGCGAAWGIVGFKRSLARAASTVREQDLFGKYRLGDEIAAGGMGTVVKATYCPEGGFARPVAVKRIHPHLADNPRFVESFRTEAELCARLLHPNIVSVLDFGREGSSYFLAMEYVDGMSAAELVDRCRMFARQVPGRVVAEVARQLLDGLHFAHAVATDEAGRPLRVVHRDLSPQNLLLSRAGLVKILDFGVAKALRDAEQHQTQHVAGNFAYMSPEQARGEPFDERADLYAVGSVLYELLVADPLFLRNNSAATLLAVIAGEVPSVAAQRPDLVGDWDVFLARAVAPDLGRRFRSAAEMRAALETLIAAEGVASPDEVRHFLRDMASLKAARRVESADAFSHHDDVTVPPGELATVSGRPRRTDVDRGDTEIQAPDGTLDVTALDPA